MKEKNANARSGLDKFLQSPFLIDRSDPLTALLVRELKVGPDSIVVEFGSGDGTFTLPIARRLESLGGRGIVFGLDYSEEMIRSLDDQAFDAGLDFRIRAKSLAAKDPTALPIREQSVDQIVSVNAAHYLPNPLAIYEAFKRILKPGGRLTIADWQSHGVQKAEYQLRDWVPSERIMFDLIVTGFQSPSLSQQPGYSWMVHAYRYIH